MSRNSRALIGLFGAVAVVTACGSVPVEESTASSPTSATPTSTTTTVQSTTSPSTTSSSIAGVEPPTGSLLADAGGTVGDLHLLAPGQGWIRLNDAVIATADGGGSWTVGFQSGADAWIFGSGQFAGTGWLVTNDGTVNASTDGGFNWERRGVLPDFNGSTGVTWISFIDDQHGWAAVHQGGGANEAALLYETGDGGHHWLEIAPSIVSGGISFTSATDGWTVGFFALGLQRTRDGGKTWTPQELPALPGQSESEPALVGAPQFIGPVGIELVAHSGYWSPPRLLLTEDGGTTWSVVPVSLPPPSSTAYGSSGVASAALVVVDPQHVRVADETRIDVTDDGGRTWVGRDVPLPVAAVAFADTDHGWVLSNTSGCRSFKEACWEASNLFATSDAGVTWTPVALPATN